MSESVSYPNANSSPSKLAIWSLVLGILSLIGFTIFTAIPGVICGHKALSKIKQSGGALTGQGLAVAGLVTGYIGMVLAIVVIPLMFAMVTQPSFVKAQATPPDRLCGLNLVKIDTAKNQWALQNNKKDGDTPTENDLLPYLDNNEMPKCPSGGSYTINPVGQNPTCSISNHLILTLP